MPFVGRDLKTLEFQKQRHLEELNQKSKNRIYFMKNKQHTQDTGSSLIAGRPEKSTLEEYLDKSKIDENIEKFIVRELGGNPGESKIFIQGLDDTLKKFLLERLPAFKKVFNDNFTISSAINLKSAFELFNREQLDKIKDLDIPTRSDLNDYLEDLFIERVEVLGLSIYQAQQEKVRRIPPVQAMRDFDNEIIRIKNNAPDEDAEEQIRRYVSSIIIAYIRTFENPLDGWMASYQIAKSIGLRDFPRPELEVLREGIPTSTINPPISSIDVGSPRSSTFYGTPRSSTSTFYGTPRRIESTQEEEKIEPQLSEEGRRLLDDARRRALERELQGSGYNTPGLVKIYKIKK